VGVEVLTTFFLCHNFGSRYDRKPIKGSKDSDDRLLSNKHLSQKNGSLAWCLWPGNGGHKNAKTPPLVTSPQENPKPKTEYFIAVEAKRLAESVGGLNIFLALAAGELRIVMELKNFVK